MRLKKTTIWLTQTALLIAILVSWQAVTTPLGMTLLTGSGVNMILAITATVFGISSGLCVAMISPIMASLIGIGPPFPIIIPFVMVGNAVFVILWHYIEKRKPQEHFRIIALLSAAGVKSGFLYVGIVLFAIPTFVPQAPPAITTMFSFAQFVTASIGGAFALAVIPSLRKALKIQIKSE
ncbi:MAG: hypothetical protein FWD34_07460 [Oscillospiraceae bacterium]|nr:hypothetical protein [Oscillospiraceae bacterium]